jgi:hypothetical protein
VSQYILSGSVVVVDGGSNSVSVSSTGLYFTIGLLLGLGRITLVVRFAGVTATAVTATVEAI